MFLKGQAPLSSGFIVVWEWGDPIVGTAPCDASKMVLKMWFDKNPMWEWGGEGNSKNLVFWVSDPAGIFLFLMSTPTRGSSNSLPAPFHPRMFLLEIGMIEFRTFYSQIICFLIELLSLVSKQDTYKQDMLMNKR